MNPCVPISINRLPKGTSGGLEEPLSEKAMLRVMAGCLSGIKQLGELGEYVTSVKVEPLIPVGLTGKGDRAAYYVVRVTLSPYQPKLTNRGHSDDPEEPTITVRREARPQWGFSGEKKISIQEAIAKAIHDGVIGEVETRVAHLEANARVWDGLLERVSK